jgi:hypothetical protein
MRARVVMCCFIAALLLGPGLGIAAGSEAAAPDEQPIPAQVAPAMKPAVMSPQMMPIAKPMVYYWAPPPRMIWPVVPQYPAPMAMPTVFWVMVPVPALTPAPVDYGPVADTPVVELPQLDATISQTMIEDAALAAALAQEGNADVGAAAVPSGAELPGMNGQPPATGEESVLASPATTEVIPVDYGPVTPTPVVDLLALQAQATGSGIPTASRAAVKTGRKSGTPAAPKPVPKSKSAPSKRMCWSKGVVAPCR